MRWGREGREGITPRFASPPLPESLSPNSFQLNPEDSFPPMDRGIDGEGDRWFDSPPPKKMIKGLEVMDYGGGGLLTGQPWLVVGQGGLSHSIRRRI